MRRSRFALGRSRIAIVPAKFFLDLHRAHGGIHLNLLVKAVVVSLRNILHKVASPRTAVTARRIEARIKAQSFTRDDRLQRSTGLQRFQFIVVLNAGQFHAVDFGILQQKRFVGRAGTSDSTASSADGDAHVDGLVQAAVVVAAKSGLHTHASREASIIRRCSFTFNGIP